MFAIPALAGLGTAMTGIGAVAGAAGSVLGGFSKAGMYNYQAGIAEINSRIEKQNADYSYNTGEIQAQEAGMKTAAQVGQTMTRQAAGNIVVGAGSSADVVASEQKLGALDRSLIFRDAAHAAYGHIVQSDIDKAQAGAYKSAATASIIGGILGGIGSLASGASSVASKWYQGESTGVFGSGADVTEDRYLKPYASLDALGAS